MTQAKETKPEIPGKAEHQRRARDVALVAATIAKCQAETKHWFCQPVKLRTTVADVLADFP